MAPATGEAGPRRARLADVEGCQERKSEKREARRRIRRPGVVPMARPLEVSLMAGVDGVLPGVLIRGLALVLADAEGRVHQRARLVHVAEADHVAEFVSGDAVQVERGARGAGALPAAAGPTVLGRDADIRLVEF